MNVQRTSKSYYFILLVLSLLTFSHAFASERKPWNLFRFLEQSSKFVDLPFGSTNAGTWGTVIKPGDVVWQPKCGSFGYSSLDDVVMGGASSSSFDNSNGVWKGTVTEANNGGFVGVRSRPNVSFDMRACRGLEVTVKLVSNSGDQSKQPRRFKFVTRDSTDFNGVTWATSVDAVPNKETKWHVPFGSQTPTRFAKVVPNEAFDKGNVVGTQLVYSKFEYGGKLNPKFALGQVELQLLEIRAF